MRKFRFQSRKFGQISFWALLAYFLIVVSIQAADITDGMIGYWPLDGDAKDVSGNDYHGELIKGAKWAANGKAGGAVEFPDGQGGYIKVAEHLTLDIVNFTVVTWINGYKAQPWAVFISARGAEGVAYWIGYHGGTDTLNCVWNDNKAETWDWQGSIKIPRDTWDFSCCGY